MYQGQAYNFANVIPTVLTSGIVNSLATFQAPDGVIVGAGQPSGVYVDVPGYVGIRCMDAPTSIARITADERKSEAQIESDNSDHVWLAAFLPEIAIHTEWRVLITDQIGNIKTMDILGAECDSQSQMTRVKVQIATV